MDTDRILAQWVLGELYSGDVPDLAIDALTAGCCAPTVAVLAGLRDPIYADVEVVAEARALIARGGLRI